MGAEAGRLSSELKARLDDLGFDWDPFDALWETMFAELKRYKERFGTGSAPTTWSPKLEHWVRKQRMLLRKERLSSERKARLDDLGFNWEPYDALWEKMFAELNRHKERFGDCNVPQKWSENLRLASWVNEQRTRGQLAPERKERLDKLGFVWNARDFGWEKMFAELERYKQRIGDSNVPQKWSENLRLANWVSDQRKAQMRGQLASEHKERASAPQTFSPRQSHQNSKRIQAYRAVPTKHVEQFSPQSPPAPRRRRTSDAPTLRPHSRQLSMVSATHAGVSATCGQNPGSFSVDQRDHDASIREAAAVSREAEAET